MPVLHLLLLTLDGLQGGMRAHQVRNAERAHEPRQRPVRLINNKNNNKRRATGMVTSRETMERPSVVIKTVS